MAKDEGHRVEFTDEELAEIKRLLDKASVELERGNRSAAHESLLAARRTYDRLAALIAEWTAAAYTEQQQVFALQLSQADQAIARCGRRLAAHAIT